MAKTRRSQAQRVKSAASDWRERGTHFTAFREVLHGLAPLDFDDRKQALRWACEFYGIDPTKVGNPGYGPQASA